jgi:hypothetical protein
MPIEIARQGSSRGLSLSELFLDGR